MLTNAILRHSRKTLASTQTKPHFDHLEFCFLQIQTQRVVHTTVPHAHHESTQVQYPTSHTSCQAFWTADLCWGRIARTLHIWAIGVSYKKVRPSVQASHTSMIKPNAVAKNIDSF